MDRKVRILVCEDDGTLLDFNLVTVPKGCTTIAYRFIEPGKAERADEETFSIGEEGQS